MKKVKLEGLWMLRCEFLDVTAERFNEVLSREEGNFELEKGVKRFFPVKKGFMKAQVPCDVITPLMENGIIQEPLSKMATKDCQWIGDMSWWFIREFEITEEFLHSEEVRLFIEILDYNADIIINGIPAAKHKNAFRPLYDDVKRFLKFGTNQIIIRLTTGYEEHYPNDSISYYCANKDGIADQRVYLRKPQFTHGWDWCKPVPTCGIGRNIYLEGISGAKIAAFRADTLEIDGNKALLNICFEIDNLSMCSADECLLRYTIDYNGQAVFSTEEELYLTGGSNYFEEKITINNPELWWPNGYGKQNLYTVKAEVECRGNINVMEEKRIGIRTISLDHSKRPDGTREFRFIVNGVKVFCKGGNWVPTDSVYLRTSYESYKTLVEEAKAANFTMLRIWGGGTYEPDYFYDLCSEKGILIMHDFMYACGYYPDHLNWFLQEAYLEAEYQTTRLAHYPCMAVWSGNNEIHESYTDWFPERQAAYRYFGTKIFNYIQPKAVKNNSPLIPYMPSSPYFGDKANNLDAGDAHVWAWMYRHEETKFNSIYELEAFDRLAERIRFSTEFGFYGGLMKSSVERFHDNEPISFDSSVWKYHGEKQHKHSRIIETINNHLTDANSLDEDNYLLYGGIIQGLLYADMALALRRRPQCSGNLIWMYNDCWPETGWTIIDYYLTRKISFYFLKRAFEFRKLIIRVKDEKAVITALNETGEAIKLSVEYGYMSFTGEVSELRTAEINMEPHSFKELEAFEAKGELRNGFYFVRPKYSSDYRAAISLRPYFRKYKFPKGKVEIIRVDRDKEDILVTIKADNYIPVLQLQLSDDRIKMEDNYFEMLPQEERTVRIYNCDEVPKLKVVEFKPL